MSRFNYAGTFQNPTNDWFVAPVGDQFGIFVRLDDGSDRPHTSAPLFDNEDDANEYIIGMSEDIEEDYDDYLDEHSDELAAMDRYEAFRNEY